MEESQIKKFSSRITWTLFTDQSLVSAGTAAAGAVTTIVAAELAGNDAWAGLPSAVLSVMAAIAAYIFGYLWERIGRRNGISLGLTIGAGGLLLMFAAVQWGSFAVLLAGNAALGFARSAMQLARFTAADVSPPLQRGRAISYVVLGGTVGAVAGPLISNPTNELGKLWGFAQWSGPILAGAILVGLAALVTFIFMRPEPSQIAREVETLYPEDEATRRRARPLSEIFSKPIIWVAVSAMAISQMVMVMVMRLTPLHMQHNAHGLDAISGVVSAHMVGMFAFSVVTGQLVDRWGRIPTILTGIGILMASFVIAPLFPNPFILGFALYLLGLGWNLCFVGGSTLLADQLSSGERSRTQGVNDFMLGFASAGGSLVAGFIFAAWGFTSLNVISAGLTLIPLALLGYWKLTESKS